MIRKRGLVLQHKEGEESGLETCQRTPKRGLVSEHIEGERRWETCHTTRRRGLLSWRCSGTGLRCQRLKLGDLEAEDGGWKLNLEAGVARVGEILFKSKA